MRECICNIKNDKIYLSRIENDPLKHAQVSVQRNLSDIKTESAFALLIIHGNARSLMCRVYHAHAYASTQLHMHVGGAQMSASPGESFSASPTCICIRMGKKNHPSRSRPSGVGSGGRTMFWASFLYGRAHVIKLMSVFD